MQDAFMDRMDHVTVAVAFNERSAGLVRAGADIAIRLGKKLCLLHIVEPWTDLPRSAPLGDNDPLWNVTQAVETNARDLAQGRLEELALLVPPSLTVERRIAYGKAAQVLGAEALALGSCLLIAGASRDDVRYLPRGMSTALSLLVTSPVPILVMDPKAATRPVDEHTRILLADDLGPSSEAAVDFATSLAVGLRGSTLHHVHVNPLTLEGLTAGFRTAGAVGPLPPASPASPGEVHEALLTSLREKLDSRGAATRDYLEAARCTYLPEVLIGGVAEQLQATSEAVDPHLVVFGRHHAYYTKPFFIGRVPYRSMLAMHRPLIVVPNE